MWATFENCDGQATTDARHAATMRLHIRVEVGDTMEYFMSQGGCQGAIQAVPFGIRESLSKARLADIIDLEECMSFVPTRHTADRPTPVGGVALALWALGRGSSNRQPVLDDELDCVAGALHVDVWDGLKVKSTPQTTPLPGLLEGFTERSSRRASTSEEGDRTGGH